MPEQQLHLAVHRRHRHSPAPPAINGPRITRRVNVRMHRTPLASRERYALTTKKSCPNPTIGRSRFPTLAGSRWCAGTSWSYGQPINVRSPDRPDRIPDHWTVSRNKSPTRSRWMSTDRHVTGSTSFAIASPSATIARPGVPVHRCRGVAARGACHRRSRWTQGGWHEA
jgi:hypothetical protein